MDETWQHLDMELEGVGACDGRHAMGVHRSDASAPSVEGLEACSGNVLHLTVRLWIAVFVVNDYAKT